MRWSIFCVFYHGNLKKFIFRPFDAIRKLNKRKLGYKPINYLRNKYLIHLDIKGIEDL